MRKKKRNYTTRWVLLGFFIFFIFLILISNINHNKSKGESTQITSVEFCNNTYIIFEDKEGNIIEGQIWYTQNGQRWEKAPILKYQKGIVYGLWVDSPTHFVYPLQFTPECINENDTKIQYVKFENNSFKRDNGRYFDVDIRDSYMYDKNKITFRTIGSDSGDIFAGYEQINMYPSPFPSAGKFMPFGGIIIFEYPREIASLSCTSDSILQQDYLSIVYTISSQTNTAKEFKINDIERDSSRKQVFCKFEFSNPENKLKINGSNFTTTIIPLDFYMSKTNELKLDLTKERDEIYKYVSNSSIEIKGVFVI